MAVRCVCIPVNIVFAMLAVLLMFCVLHIINTTILGNRSLGLQWDTTGGLNLANKLAVNSEDSRDCYQWELTGFSCRWY